MVGYLLKDGAIWLGYICTQKSRTTVDFLLIYLQHPHCSMTWHQSIVPLDIWVWVCCIRPQDLFELSWIFMANFDWAGSCCEITELDWHPYIQEDCRYFLLMNVFCCLLMQVCIFIEMGSTTLSHFWPWPLTLQLVRKDLMWQREHLDYTGYVTITENTETQVVCFGICFIS